LITLSTRAQVESKKADTNTLQAVKRIIEREGIAGLYAGLESALFGITVTNFVYYYCVYLTTSRKLKTITNTFQGMSSPGTTLSGPCRDPV
jgi:adenine nucleotide transporter 17